MVYRRIQYFMHKQGYNHKRIYVEGFSDTVSKFTIADLRKVSENHMKVDTSSSVYLDS